MRQHKLDEDGLASSYLLLTAIIPVILYLLYSCLRKHISFNCNCKNCLQKKKDPKTTKFALLTFLILILSILLRNIFTIKIKMAKLAFDPYSVLNITIENTEAEIRKAYKRLLRSFSKKLNSKATKDVAEEGIKNLNKAYSILKDAKSLDAFLNSSATSELLIALPSFILNFSTPFLVFYIVLITLAVPLFFLSKHRNFKKISSDGSHYVSNELFLTEIENLSEIPTVLIQQLFVIVGESEEFKNRKWLETLPNSSEDELGVPLVRDSEGYLRIVFYLARKLTNFEDKSFIVASTLSLIESFKKIAMEKEKSKILENLIIFKKMVIQAVITSELSLAQYPGISFEKALEKGSNNLKTDELTISEVLKGKDLDVAMNVLKSIPTASIQDLKAFTFQTQDLEGTIEKNFVSAKTPQNISKDAEFFVIQKDYAPNVSFNLVCENTSQMCHAPFSKSVILNKWYIFYTVNDLIIGEMIILNQFEGKKSIQFSLPFGSGKQIVKIYIMSNGYFGNDLVGALNIKYV